MLQYDFIQNTIVPPLWSCQAPYRSYDWFRQRSRDTTKAQEFQNEQAGHVHRPKNNFLFSWIQLFHCFCFKLIFIFSYLYLFTVNLTSSVRGKYKLFITRFLKLLFNCNVNMFCYFYDNTRQKTSKKIKHSKSFALHLSLCPCSWVDIVVMVGTSNCEPHGITHDLLLQLQLC